MTDRHKKSQSISNDKAEQRKKQDEALWDAVTQEITPLESKNTVYRGKEKDKQQQTISDRKDKPGKNISTTQIDTSTKKAPSDNATGIDHRTRQRLKRGKIPIDGKLDLHGKTQNEAYDALQEYIPMAQTSGKRCILIITGKGLPRHGDPSLIECSEHIGVLKQKTPYWLSSPPLLQYILDIQPARPNHGGEGALYVLLRRKRK